jgi:hypothetical protein
MSKGLCPICGEDNNCSLVAGLEASTCWCMTTKVPSELLDRVPMGKRRDSCVCKECINRYNKESL